MKRNGLIPLYPILFASILLITLFGFAGKTRTVVNAAPSGATTSLTISSVQPDSAPNDVDTQIVIQGTGFTATISGTEVITAPTVYLGDTDLADIVWGSTTTLSATIPWGLEPQVYSLAVENPDGISITLQNAFTVTDGFGEFITGGPYGGIAVQLQQKPDDPATLYALMYGVGLFISEDAGENWELVTNQGYPYQLDFDSEDSDVLYLSAEGLVRSMDNGENWESIFENYYTQNGCYQTYAVAHPTQQGNVYVGIGSCRGIPLETGEGGIFFSTDYGDTWNPRNTGLSDLDISALAIHPITPTTLIAGTFDGDLFYSLNGGDNWSWSTQLTGTVSSLYFNPYETLEAWAITRSETEGHAYVYRSLNLTDWIPQNLSLSYTGGPTLAQMDFLPDSVWLGAINVYTSTDSGGTWNTGNSPMWGATALAISPDNPQTIFVGTDFGVEKSTDGGNTWTEKIEGLAALVPTAIAVSPDDPDHVYVKTHPGIFVSHNGGNHWQYLNYGIGGYTSYQSLAVDRFDASRIYLNAGCTGEFCIDISTDQGASWNLITSTLPVTYTGWQCNSFTILPSPHTPNRVLVGAALTPPGGGNVESIFYTSSNGGANWNHVLPPQTIGEVAEMVYDGINPNLIYAGTVGSGLWRSEDGGDNWLHVPISGTQTPVSVAAIAMHPNISNKVYLRTYSGPSPNPEPELWVSEDAGNSWEPIGYVFTGVDLLVSPPTPGQILYTLYTGGAEGNVDNSSGLYRSIDDGQSWSLIPGVPRPEILVGASDGERAIVYMGIPGGLASSAGTISSNQFTPLSGGVYRLQGGGVYRLTILLPTDFVYLPIIRR